LLFLIFGYFILVALAAAWTASLCAWIIGASRKNKPVMWIGILMTLGIPLSVIIAILTLTFVAAITAKQAGGG
jgi:hypothetical protein